MGKRGSKGMERQPRGVLPNCEASLAAGGSCRRRLSVCSPSRRASARDIFPVRELAAGMRGYTLLGPGGRRGCPALRRRDRRRPSQLRPEAGSDPRAHPLRSDREDGHHRRDERKPGLRRREARRRPRVRLAVLAGADLRHHADPEHARHPQGAAVAAGADRRRGGDSRRPSSWPGFATATSPPSSMSCSLR